MVDLEFNWPSKNGVGKAGLNKVNTVIESAEFIEWCSLNCCHEGLTLV